MASWRSLLQPQDIGWLLLFAALAASSPAQSAAEVQLLALFAALQVLAPRIPWFSTSRGLLLLIGLKLALGFLLVGFTGGILSSYFLILLLPILSAATHLSLRGTTAVTLLACAAYLAFLPVAWNLGYELDRPLLRDVVLRVLFLPVVSFVAYELAESTRTAARRAQTNAEELARANALLRQAESSARRAERLAALGQLTAGLAHELRNPLGTMKASAEMLTERLSPTDPVACELAGYISSEVDRTNALVSRFLDFSRPFHLQLCDTDLNAVADLAVEHLQREQPGLPLPIHRNYDPTLPRVRADAELLERLVFNLVQNALQASPPGALVTLKTRGTSRAVELSVIDRGPGIQEADREQIFNPFFTTRDSGTGLGLAICARIASEHGAHLEVESSPGQGASFTLHLPLQPVLQGEERA